MQEIARLTARYLAKYPDDKVEKLSKTVRLENNITTPGIMDKFRMVKTRIRVLRYARATMTLETKINFISSLSRTRRRGR